MQNLTTTLLLEIKTKHKISLPSGKAKFNWIDVENIGEAIAQLILQFDQYKNQAFEITGSEIKDFYFVAELLSDVLRKPIEFKSVNPLHFYFIKRKEGIASPFVLVMLMLHFLPRFQEQPQITDTYEMLTGKNPTTLRDFIVREKSVFE